MNDLIETDVDASVLDALDRCHTAVCQNVAFTEQHRMGMSISNYFLKISPESTLANSRGVPEASHSMTLKNYIIKISNLWE